MTRQPDPPPATVEALWDTRTILTRKKRSVSPRAEVVRGLHLRRGTELAMNASPTQPNAVPTDATSSDELPCLDQEVFGELALLSARRPDFLSKMISRFVDHAQRTAARLEESLEHGDMRQATFVAHMFKGAARQLGAVRLAAEAEALVQHCEREQLDEARAQLRRLEAARSATLRELLAYDTQLH